ncbi:ATP-binding protein [Streptomyces sp. NPDC047000]|uniref:ATP-binding protein n=1 Tax=Streptomyces sp. NPDC047000 TaxID=3155474 RepID=UPI0034020896
MESREVVAAPPAPCVTQFSILLSATARGARLARHLAAQQLASWGIPYTTDLACAAALVTAELAANAVTHGRLPGRDFRLTLLKLPDRIRVEVTDARPERVPPTAPVAAPPAPESDSGRGLLLVEAYADRWGCEVRDDRTKTVWAEIAAVPGVLLTA